MTLPVPELVTTNDLVCVLAVRDVPKLKLEGVEVSGPSVVPVVLPPTPETAMVAVCDVPRLREPPVMEIFPLRVPVAFGVK